MPVRRQVLAAAQVVQPLAHAARKQRRAEAPITCQRRHHVAPPAQRVNVRLLRALVAVRVHAHQRGEELLLVVQHAGPHPLMARHRRQQRQRVHAHLRVLGLHELEHQVLETLRLLLLLLLLLVVVFLRLLLLLLRLLAVAVRAPLRPHRKRHHQLIERQHPRAAACHPSQADVGERQRRALGNGAIAAAAFLLVQQLEQRGQLQPVAAAPRVARHVGQHQRAAVKGELATRRRRRRRLAAAAAAAATAITAVALVPSLLLLRHPPPAAATTTIQAAAALSRHEVGHQHRHLPALLLRQRLVWFG